MEQKLQQIESLKSEIIDAMKNSGIKRQFVIDEILDGQELSQSAIASLLVFVFMEGKQAGKAELKAEIARM